jgi:uncharacterized membrane protein YkoI
MGKHMMHHWRIRITCLLAACMLFGMRVVLADDDHALARRLSEAGQILPLEDIAARARTVKPGELLEADLEIKKGRYVYEVEILDKAGQVWELKLDAASGQLIKMELDD